jgi:8-oxo-dGTP pyrophosphatase MutT (NUDIX family)
VSTDPLRCVGALIVDDDGRVFVQRRSADRRLFPGSWDIVGGHVEPGESLDAALRREIAEETGWALFQILGTVGEYGYTGNDGVARLETDFLVRVDGDLSRPRLEAGKHADPRWLSEAETALLDDPPDVNDGLIRRIVEDGFALIRRISGIA